MNDRVRTLYNEWLHVAHHEVAAATLVLCEVLAEQSAEHTAAPAPLAAAVPVCAEPVPEDPKAVNFTLNVRVLDAFNKAFN